MKIVMTSDWFSPSTGGGAERVAFEIGTRLAARGHQLCVVATRPGQTLAYDIAEGVEVHAARARSLTHLLRAQVSVAPTFPVLLWRTVRRANPDVIWAHSLQFQTTPFAALVARAVGVPFVVTAHLGDLDAIDGWLGSAARLHERTIGRATLRLAQRAIAVSEPVAAHVQALDRRLAVDVVPNGVDHERFKPQAPALRMESSLRVGFLGRLVVNKGPETAIAALIELLRRGVHATLSLVGEGPERGRLEEVVAHAGISDRVRFEGYRDDPEHWFHTIDVLARPSLTEGMPLAVLEAMASGVPVVASDVPGNRSVVDDGVTGLLIPARDPLALANALERLARSPDLRVTLRQRSLDATHNLSWDRSADLTAESLQRARAITRAHIRTPA